MSEYHYTIANRGAWAFEKFIQGYSTWKRFIHIITVEFVGESFMTLVLTFEGATLRDVCSWLLKAFFLVMSEGKRSEPNKHWFTDKSAVNSSGTYAGSSNKVYSGLRISQLQKFLIGYVYFLTCLISWIWILADQITGQMMQLLVVFD